eukprot:12922934-Prorocentrum_lima.AAC.1
MQSSPRASSSLRHSRSTILRSPSPKRRVNGVHMKRAFIATTKGAAIAHVLARQKMPPVDFPCPSSITLPP